MRIKHYFAFDENVSGGSSFGRLNSDNWDILRTNNIPGSFSIEREIGDFERNCSTATDYKEAAEIICRIIKDYKLGDRLASLGCGKGIVEWHIKKMMPELYVECTDYAEKGIEQLSRVFVDCDEFGTFDILSGDYGKWKSTETVLLMYRVSTEFSRKQWELIFDKIYNANINYIIFIPTEIVTLHIALNEKKRWLEYLLSGKKATFCGWMYSKSEIYKFLRDKRGKIKYEVEMFERIRDTGVFMMKRVEAFNKNNV